MDLLAKFNACAYLFDNLLFRRMHLFHHVVQLFQVEVDYLQKLNMFAKFDSVTQNGQAGAF